MQATFILSPVDRVKLGIDIVVKVELGHADDLLDGLLQVHILGHIGGCGDVKDHLGCVNGAKNTLLCQLSPHPGFCLYIILTMAGGQCQSLLLMESVFV